MSDKLTELTLVEAAGDGTLLYLVDPNRTSGDQSVAMTKESLAALLGTTSVESNPIENEYVDNAAMFADQGNQTTAFFQYVTGADNYYEKLSTSTGTIDDYRLLSDTETQVLRGRAGYNVLRLSDIQDDASPLTSINGGRVGIEYDNGTDAVTGVFFNELFTDAITDLVALGTGNNLVLYNQDTGKYHVAEITAYSTVNTDYTLATLASGIDRTEFSVNDSIRVIFDLGGTGGSGVPASDTGTTITFTEDTLWNEATYLTSGALTLDLTGAVKGTIQNVYCNGYSPSISGEDYFLSSGFLDSNSLNILSFFYDGTKIYLNVGNVSTLTAPTLTLTAGDEEMQIDWDAITDATNYVIERSTDNFATAGTEIYSGALLTFTDTALTNGTTYYYRGKAEATGFIESVYSTIVSDVPSGNFYAGRVPVIGYSINEKLNPSATLALQVSTNADGTGTTTDIGFDGNNVDTAAITALGGDQYISKIYNQGSGGATYDQTIFPTYSGQKILVSGVLQTKNGLAAGFSDDTIKYESANAYANFGGDNSYSIFSVTASSNTETQYTVLYTGGTATAGALNIIHDTRTTPFRNNQVHGTTFDLSAARVDTDQRILMTLKDGTSVSTFDNNATGQSGTKSGSSANDPFYLLGNRASIANFRGYFQSLLVYGSDVGTTEKDAIRDHLNSVYTIY